MCIYIPVITITVQPPDNQIPQYNNDNRCDKCELLYAIKIIIRYKVPTETRNNQHEYYTYESMKL